MRALGQGARAIPQVFFVDIAAHLRTDAAGMGLLFFSNSLFAVIATLLFPSLASRVPLAGLAAIGLVSTTLGVTSLSLASNLTAAIITFGVVGGTGWALFSLRSPYALLPDPNSPRWSRMTTALAAGPLVCQGVASPLLLWISASQGWMVATFSFASVLLLGGALTLPVLRSGRSQTANHPLRPFVPTFRWSWPVAFSGLIAGFFGAHLYAYANAAGLARSALPAWAIGFGLLAVLSQWGWARAVPLPHGSAAVTCSLWLAAASGILPAFWRASVYGLLASGVYISVAAALYIEALHQSANLTDVRSQQQTLSFQIVTHMLAGALGSVLGGIGATHLGHGDYRLMFQVLALTSLALAALRQAASPRR